MYDPSDEAESDAMSDEARVFGRASGPLPRLAEPFSRWARARRLRRFMASAGIGPQTRILDSARAIAA